MNDKAALRQKLKFDCQTRMPAFNKAHAQTIAGHVFKIIQGQNPKPMCIAVYHALSDEVDSRPLIQLLRQDGYALALPLMISKDRPLIFRQWNIGDKLDKTRYGLAQPRWSAPEIKPNLMIVPLLGFNAAHYRLGRGAGAYDRTLAVDGDIVTIGMAASFQQVTFEPEAHDIALSHIVTEQGCLTSPVLPS